MSRPRRESKLRRRSPLDELRLTLALDIGPDPFRDHDLTDDVLREVWMERRDTLIAEQGRAGSWGFWRFENVPRPLHAQRPALTPIGDDDPAGSPNGEADRALQDRRAAWLAEHSPAA